MEDSCHEVPIDYCLDSHNFDSPCCVGSSVDFAPTTGVGFAHDAIRDAQGYFVDWGIPVVFATAAIAAAIRSGF